MATKFGTKWAITRPPQKKIARCLHLPPLFSGTHYPMVSFKFFRRQPPLPYGNKFWDKIGYNSTPIKDNCTLFALTPYFWARAIRRCHLNFSPANPRCHGNEFWDKIGYNSAPVKDNCALFAPTPLFSGLRYLMVSLKFFPCQPPMPWQQILGQTWL